MWWRLSQEIAIQPRNCHSHSHFLKLPLVAMATAIGLKSSQECETKQWPHKLSKKKKCKDHWQNSLPIFIFEDAERYQKNKHDIVLPFLDWPSCLSFIPMRIEKWKIENIQNYHNFIYHLNLNRKRVKIFHWEEEKNLNGICR